MAVLQKAKKMTAALAVCGILNDPIPAFAVDVFFAGEAGAMADLTAAAMGDRMNIGSDKREHGDAKGMRYAQR